MSTPNDAGNVIQLAPQSFPVSLFWSTYKKNLKVPSIRLSDLSLHKPFQSFALSVAATTNEQPRAFKSRLHALAYALLEYAMFLESINKTWIDADDALLVEYRDYSYEKVKSTKISRGEITAKQTTNIKLQILYELYVWAEHGIETATPSIGWEKDASIRSTLPLKNANPNKWNCLPKRLYPQCFQDAEDSSSSMGGQHWATEAELNDIEDYFRDSNFSVTAERNAIFLRTVDQTGLRRGSANSLVIGQFSDEAIGKSIQAELHSHSVQPSKQKNSSRNFFDVPYPLAWEINRYIKSLYGDDIFVRTKHKKTLAKLPLFVSMTSKEAISDQTWTDIFTDAFQAIGAPLGSGIHSVRRKFAEDWFRKEIQRYIDQGLPISYTDIVAGLAKVLGHDSKLSQEAYRRASSLSRVNSPLDVLTEQNRELAVRNMQLTAQLVRKDEEITRLRALLAAGGQARNKSGVTAKRPLSPVHV